MIQTARWIGQRLAKTLLYKMLKPEWMTILKIGRMNRKYHLKLAEWIENVKHKTIFCASLANSLLIRSSRWALKCALTTWAEIPWSSRAEDPRRHLPPDCLNLLTWVSEVKWGGVNFNNLKLYLFLRRFSVWEFDWNYFFWSLHLVLL